MCEWTSDPTLSCHSSPVILLLVRCFSLEVHRGAASPQLALDDGLVGDIHDPVDVILTVQFNGPTAQQLVQVQVWSGLGVRSGLQGAPLDADGSQNLVRARQRRG